MNTPEPVDETPVAPAETRGGNSPVDYMPSWGQLISEPAEGCDDEDCDCEEPA